MHLPGFRGAGSRGTGSRGVENAGSGGKHRVRWKTRGPVENAGSGGKRGVWWKTWGLVENAGSGGKRGVRWKTRSLRWKTRETTMFRQNRSVSSWWYGPCSMLVCFLLEPTSVHKQSKGFHRNVVMMMRATQKEQATTSFKTNFLNINNVESNKTSRRFYKDTLKK